jgi:methyl-accepting chemotaxis protein
MRVDRVLRLGIASGLILQILATLLGVVLLSRLAPTIERIVSNNAAPMAAINDAQRLLLNPQATPEAIGEAFLAISAPESISPALALRIASGHPGARLEAQRALVTLSQHYLANLRAADARAQSEARAGAWTLVVLGIIGVALGLLAVRRSHQLLIEPLARLTRAAEAWRQGDTLVRPDTGDMPPELATLAGAFNQLLDNLRARERWAASGADAVHAGLLGLLEQRPGAAVLVDAQGQQLAANLAGLERIAEVEAARPALPERWTETAFDQGVRLLCAPS